MKRIGQNIGGKNGQKFEQKIGKINCAKIQKNTYDKKIRQNLLLNRKKMFNNGQ